MPLFGALGAATALQPGVKSTLLFLWHLAWRCRVRLPVLLTVTLLVMDARMRIEINMDVEEIDEPPLAEELGDAEQEDEEEDSLLDELSDSDDSEDMWPLDSASDGDEPVPEAADGR
ncbi:uncharacterized protein LOC122369360 [Amphibalanus amphitrite]|uniref:uncharacterized protein LOC122369360 n=1 Tax=Amphibalanus amphitrite TaxID=1232801 RepID=UPI001C913F51|nr:uncharacterized protein LOC122369360 [Amphibalanus amphitrite]XP_043199982.1 uncharacterized protein LOC122369360 [Amphibalanus amphitrite]XP_043199985.1 uncharacterized protein LOC122369360 [Amphibalanus amphitrite]XP_043199986.1 uncharacterized protein LOC122369360 [Amphibalanus amphitrite]XP_043199987.1 uncharacterized protein LOC122369360 [Amphibalanus amphitrite]XP_043199988.1 uncharacterized protein LOC122369360 [Amphibalanus amphitrite]XP_043199989.1 uncharacterized protein LOC12236